MLFGGLNTMLGPLYVIKTDYHTHRMVSKQKPEAREQQVIQILKLLKVLRRLESQ